MASPAAAPPALAVGVLRGTGTTPVLMGSAIPWDIPTGLLTTCAHVVLDCRTVSGVKCNTASRDYTSINLQQYSTY
jgi:hypothetical protein